jgi:4-hydroxy-tetrahydrodipicolinate synthase
VIETRTPPFGRLATAMVTPFDEDSKIDFLAVDRVVGHLLRTGSETLVVNGTTGENPTLDNDESSELLGRVRERVGKKAKVVMGTGTNSTAKTIKAGEQAEKLGADGLLVVVPYYNKPSPSGLLAHFSAVAEATSLPIIIYNIPGRTCVNLPVDTTLELIEKYPNIHALKDSTGNTEQTAEIAAKARSDFRIYSGDDYLLLPFLSVGACGVVSVASHVVGTQIAKLMSDFFAGNTENARKLFYANLPLFRALFTAPNPTCVKYALSKVGLCKPTLRLPLVELNTVQRSVLDVLLSDYTLDDVQIQKEAVTS